MLQQIEKTGVGIRFDQSALSDWRAAYHAAYSPSLFQARDPAIEDGAVFEGATAYNSNANILPEVGDALAVQKWGDLITVPLWWILECFPFRRMYQDLNDPKKRWRSSFW